MSTQIGTAPDHHMNLRRYLLATLLPTVILALLLSVYLYDHLRQYSFTKTEIMGVQVIQEFYDTLTDLQKIRGYKQILLWKEDDTVKKRLERLENSFLARFQTKEWQEGIESFQLRREAERLEKEARQLFAASYNSHQETELFNRFSALIADILQLMQLTASHSNLILDPETDAHYLIDVLVRQIPYLVEAIGRVRGMGSGLLAKAEISHEEREILQRFYAAVETWSESIENAQDVIIKTSSDLQDSLHLLPVNLKSSLAPIISVCKRIEDGHKHITMDPKRFFQLATKVIDLMSEPYRAGIAILMAKLKKRQSRNLWQGGLFLLGTGIVILLMLYFNRSFYLHDQELHREMETLSITDQLTGLYNRRHLYTVFPVALRNALRFQQRLYLGLIDIDNFKRYDDTYGHPAGDRVLQETSKTMQRVLQRASDYCFRVGGEEFCFIFNETETDNAIKFCDGLRQAIQNLNIPHQGNPPFNVVTVSIGLVMVPPDQTEGVLSQAMASVDKALYEAKANGRNQCVWAS
jgi:diguanylate cyclase (GGDEF)-like protein